MERFSLEKWLKDKSRKVVTREGRNVRIICTDYHNMRPIIALVQDKGMTSEGTRYYDNNGIEFSNDGITPHPELDLFFADEEEELTEFEQCLKSGTNIYVEQGRRMEDWDAKEDTKELLNLARKEILKDLPKWKKMPNGIQGNGDFNPTYLVRVSNGYYFTAPCISWDKDSMYIELSELEKLPKEE